MEEVLSAIAIVQTKYAIQWDPIAFLKDQEYKEDPAEALPIVITLTGSADNAQALTCSQYLQQKWPSYGLQVLELIQSVLRSQPNVPAGSTLTDGTVLTAQIQSSKLSETPIFSVEIVGTVEALDVF